MSREYHPDKHPDEKAEYEEKFKKLGTAVEQAMSNIEGKSFNLEDWKKEFNELFE